MGGRKFYGEHWMIDVRRSPGKTRPPRMSHPAALNADICAVNSLVRGSNLLVTMTSMPALRSTGGKPMFSSPHTSPSVFLGNSRPTLRLEFADFHTLTY